MEKGAKSRPKCKGTMGFERKQSVSGYQVHNVGWDGRVWYTSTDHMSFSSEQKGTCLDCGEEIDIKNINTI